jgi:hypothetical protein
MRQFDTGATRDSEDGKLEPWGFSSALVEKRFSEYMHGHREQADGELRASNNWCNGIPTSAYWHSLSRHLNDLRLIAEGYSKYAEEMDLETVLCAVKFNVDGLLYEVIKGAKLDASPVPKGTGGQIQIQWHYTDDDWQPELTEEEDRAF